MFRSLRFGSVASRRNPSGSINFMLCQLKQAHQRFFIDCDSLFDALDPRLEVAHLVSS
jgi:hypothetical protein